ncbi:hypothetical protein [Yersinia pestis]|uniref:hypothetical protein n=1 Tax=Yersinia pestis TaxID=632 RepID=UPI00402B151F
MLLVASLLLVKVTPQHKPASAFEISDFTQHVMHLTPLQYVRLTAFYKIFEPIPRQANSLGDDLQKQEAAPSASPIPRNTSTAARSGAQVSFKADNLPFPMRQRNAAS